MRPHRLGLAQLERYGSGTQRLAVRIASGISACHTRALGLGIICGKRSR